MKKTEIKINNVKTKSNENSIINFIKSNSGNSTNNNSNKTSNPPSTNGKVKEEIKKNENLLSNNDSINITKLVGNVVPNTVNEDEFKSGVISRKSEDENFEIVDRLQDIYKKYKGIFDLADAEDFEIIIETLKNNLMNEN